MAYGICIRGVMRISIEVTHISISSPFSSHIYFLLTSNTKKFADLFYLFFFVCVKYHWDVHNAILLDVKIQGLISTMNRKED